MTDRLDPRVVSAHVVDIIKAYQSIAPASLGGGVALSGGHLHHRLSHDIDFVCRQPEHVRALASNLINAVSPMAARCTIVQDAGTFVRAIVHTTHEDLRVDITYESTPPLAPPLSMEGVLLESLEDMRASKLTCILSRSEPRDLVDLLFLDRAGYPPEGDLAPALTKDSGIDPAVLAWLLVQFPLEPTPRMLIPISQDELRAFRDQLAQRFRAIAIPSD